MRDKLWLRSRVCSHAFDKLDITPKQRAEYQKACVANAQANKAACETGTNACLDACTGTYNDSIVACEATYDAAVTPCGGDILCLATAASNRAVCISAVTDALDICNQACGLDEWTVESVDLRACTPDETLKTTICHIPPGNPANAHTLCIGTPAVKHHLKNHGDTSGRARPSRGVFLTQTLFCDPYTSSHSPGLILSRIALLAYRRSPPI